MSEFANTTLLECTRNQSNQGESDDSNNYSLWTNRMGRTINLNIGDTLEVKSAYINQRGSASPDSIEFKGTDLGIKCEFDETQIVKEAYTYDQMKETSTYGTDVPGTYNWQQGDLGFRFIKNVKVEKSLTDNILYLEQQFYKNANGEETIMLPRSYNRVRFTEISNREIDFPLINQAVSSYWTLSDLDYDFKTNDKTYVPGINTGTPLLKVGNRYIDQTNGDSHDRVLVNLFNTHDWECSFLQGIQEDAGDTAPGITASISWQVKQRNDNSRFTLFEREFDFMIWSGYEVKSDTNTEDDTYNPKFEVLNDSDGDTYNLSSKKWFENNTNIPTFDNGDNNNNFPYGYRHIVGAQPSLCRYKRRTDLLKIKLKTGFNSPESVADQITQQLQEQDKNSPIIYDKNFDIFRESVSVGISTPTFKPVLCSNYRDTNNIFTHEYTNPTLTATLNNFNSYFYPESTTNAINKSNSAFEWWRAHHNIYVKRPDLFIAGRDCNSRYACVHDPTKAGISSVNIVSGGTGFNQGGYYENVTLKSSSGEGFGAIGDVYIGPTGNIAIVTITKPGDFYSIGTSLIPDTSIIGNGTGYDLKVNELRPSNDSEHDDIDLNLTGRRNYILNQIPLENPTTLKNNLSSPIVTSWEWNDANLQKLRKLFQVQGQYPELFTGSDNTIQNTEYLRNRHFTDGNQYAYYPACTIDNSRFLHINRFNYFPGSYPNGFTTLGDDDYNDFTYHRPEVDEEKQEFNLLSHMSMPVFFYYQKENANKYTGGLDVNDLCYGFASRTPTTYGGSDNVERDYIRVHPEMLVGIRQEAFLHRGGKNSNSGIWTAEGIEPGTCLIGWDWHWNSYGNLVMLKDTGIPANDQGSGGAVADRGKNTLVELDKTFSIGTGGTTNNYTGDKPLNLSYIGTNNIACKYNSANKNFFFEYLHTPERINNNWNSGIAEETGGTTTSSVAIVDGQGTEVYKINKRLYGWTFCPDMCPYLNNDIFILGTNGTPPSMSINSFSQLVAWKIYDSHMGVNLNFGKSALISTNDFSNKSQLQIWNNSVLGIMGFSFDQFNPKNVIFTENGAQARIRYDNNESLYNPTTNCQVVNTDTNQFVLNPFGAVQYSTQLPYGMVLRNIQYQPFGQALQTGVESQYLPAISQQTQSIQITGVNLPRVVLKPFYSIRTDILSQDRYVGGMNGGLALPIIASINRINADKDFVQFNGGSEIFTITTPLSFSSITTAITDSDGRLTELDDGSVVIYKITKNDNLQNYDVLSQIMAKLKK